MRLLFGMIIGAGLTVGGAYLHDSSLSGPFQARQQLVNWDVASNLAGSAYQDIRAQIREWTGP